MRGDELVKIAQRIEERDRKIAALLEACEAAEKFIAPGYDKMHPDVQPNALHKLRAAIALAKGETT